MIVPAAGNTLHFNNAEESGKDKNFIGPRSTAARNIKRNSFYPRPPGPYAFSIPSLMGSILKF